MTQLQKIVAKAKSLKKSYPNTKWTDLIKKASKLVTPAKKSVSGIKRTIVKKSAPAIPLIKKRIVSRSDFAMAGVKKKYTEKQLEKLADDYAYVTSGDLDRALFWLFDPEYTDTLIPKYEKAVKDYEKKHNIKISGVKKKKATKKAVKKSPARSMHKDTKSHNVNIRVMSGVNSKLNELKQMRLKLKEALSNYKKEKDSLIKMYINAHRISPLRYNIKKLETELKSVKRELNKIK
jgi:hypothetical protein